MKHRQDPKPLPKEHWGVALNSSSNKAHLWHEADQHHLSRCGWRQRPYAIGAVGPRSVRCLTCSKSMAKAAA